MRNLRPKTTAVGVIREGSALIGRASSMSIECLGMLIGLAHNALDKAADVSVSTAQLTKEGYQRSRQQENQPTQRELPLDDHPA